MAIGVYSHYNGTVWFNGIKNCFTTISFFISRHSPYFFSTLSLFGLSIEVKTKNELWLAPVIGLINGLLTGMTGIFVLPCVFYFQAIRLHKESLVQSMGILFSALTMMMIFSLKTKNILTLELSLWSSIAILPEITGVLIGQLIRKIIPEDLFKKIFFFCLILLGNFILVN